MEFVIHQIDTNGTEHIYLVESSSIYEIMIFMSEYGNDLPYWVTSCGNNQGKDAATSTIDANGVPG